MHRRTEDQESVKKIGDHPCPQTMRDFIFPPGNKSRNKQARHNKKEVHQVLPVGLRLPVRCFGRIKTGSCHSRDAGIANQQGQRDGKPKVWGRFFGLIHPAKLTMTGSRKLMPLIRKIENDQAGFLKKQPENGTILDARQDKKYITFTKIIV